MTVSMEIVRIAKSRPRRTNPQDAGIYLKVAENSFQHLHFDGPLQPLLSLDATIMISKNCSTIGKHVVTLFVTQ